MIQRQLPGGWVFRSFRLQHFQEPGIVPELGIDGLREIVGERWARKPGRTRRIVDDHVPPDRLAGDHFMGGLSGEAHEVVKESIRF